MNLYMRSPYKMIDLRAIQRKARKQEFDKFVSGSSLDGISHKSHLSKHKRSLGESTEKSLKKIISTY
jgi:hypothetical protein